jgi:murein endopeptidase
VRLAIILLALALPAVLLTAPRDADPPPPPLPQPLPPVATPAPLPSVATPGPARARASRALGVPWRGRLLHGRRLPARGPGYVTWDPILKRVGNRPWRRWGTERLLRTLENVLAEHARRNPGAPPVLVGDLSRPAGGDFGPRFGGIGHASHQNGLDADVYYPRRDGRLLRARRPDQVDRAAAQSLVDAFVRAGAKLVFVGPSLGLRGPPKIVQPLVYHDDHLHVRLRGSG